MQHGPLGLQHEPPGFCVATAVRCNTNAMKGHETASIRLRNVVIQAPPPPLGARKPPARSRTVVAAVRASPLRVASPLFCVATLVARVATPVARVASQA